ESVSPFTEASAWTGLSEGWSHLHGSFRKLGYSIEWHDFKIDEDFEWSRSFHPGGLEICLNLDGHGEGHAGNERLEFVPFTAGFYLQTTPRLKALRKGGERHRFMTIELARDFLGRHVTAGEQSLHPRVNDFLSSQSAASAVSELVRLSSEHQALASSLR